jgi:mono/diheme cytochrome c family protein
VDEKILSSNRPFQNFWIYGACMKRWQWLIWLFWVGVLVMGCQAVGDEGGSTAVSPNELPTFPAPPTLDPEEIAQGEQVYITYCASCHGANLEGEANWKEQNEDKSFRAPPHDASGHTWHHADSLLIESVALGGTRFETMNIGGTSNMPAFGGILTEAEIRAVLTYIKSTWPEETRATQWEVTVMTENQ